MIVTEREREAETQAEGEAGSMHSMHQKPDVGFDPGSPGSRPGPKAGAKPLHHPGIPRCFFKIFIYDRHRERDWQRHRQREKQAPCREPDAELDPGTPGSRPGPKAGAKPLSHPGIP